MAYRILVILVVALLPLMCAAASSSPPKPVVIAYANAWAPMSEGDGEVVVGILPRLMERLIRTELGRPVVHIGMPWGRAQSAVRSGAVDAFVTTPTQERLGYASSSRNVVYPLQFRAFTLEGSPQSKALQAGVSIEDLSSTHFCDVLGNGWAEQFYQQINRPVFWAPEIGHCLRMLAKGRTDVVVHSTAVTRLEIDQLGLGPVLRMHPTVYPGAEFTLLISKASPIPADFLTDFDRLLDRMKDSGDYERLVEEVLEETLSNYSNDSNEPLPR